MAKDKQLPAKIAGKGIDIAYGQRRIIERLDLAVPDRKSVV